MATLKVYNGASWITAVSKVWDGAAWSEKMYFYDGTAWVALFPSGVSVVVAPTKTILDAATDPADAIAQVKVDSDGSLYENIGAGFVSYEAWLDAGSNTQVWVERTIISGTLDVDAGSGRLACTADRIFGVTQTVLGSKATVIDLKFYDAASGGSLLDTQRVTLDVTVL